MPSENRLPITVYSTPGCPQCNLTKTWLESHDFRYRDIDLSEDTDALQKVKGMGYQSAPVVIVPFEYEARAAHWFGFRPDLLSSIK